MSFTNNNGLFVFSDILTQPTITVPFYTAPTSEGCIIILQCSYRYVTGKSAYTCPEKEDSTVSFRWWTTPPVEFTSTVVNKSTNALYAKSFEKIVSYNFTCVISNGMYDNYRTVTKNCHDNLIEYNNTYVMTDLNSVNVVVETDDDMDIVVDGMWFFFQIAIRIIKCFMNDHMCCYFRYHGNHNLCRERDRSQFGGWWHRDILQRRPFGFF